MASSDLDTLIDMGFEKPRAELAVKKTGGCKSPIRLEILIREANVITSAGSLGVAREESGQVF